MSFFNLSDNSEAQSDGSFEMGGGNIDPIPDNTMLLAMAGEAKWDSYKDEEFISIRWTVIQPAEYKNRKVYQKVRVLDGDPKKADKAKRMLAAIDANAGGKLTASGDTPTDQTLTSILNKPMVLNVLIWFIDNPDGTQSKGNWVNKVSPRVALAPANVATGKPAGPPVIDIQEDDIPW